MAEYAISDLPSPTEASGQMISRAKGFVQAETGSRPKAGRPLRGHAPIFTVGWAPCIGPGTDT